MEPILNDLLVDPAREVGDALVAALRAAGKDGPADALAPWAADKFPATFGTASLVLLALRYGTAAGDPACRDFIARHFRGDFASLASNKALGSTVDVVRNTFRNPACHGKRTFSPDDYTAFARLVVGRRRLADWAGLGSVSGPDGGVLHHHLAGSLRVGPPLPAPPSDPAVRLLELTAPRASALGVTLAVVPGPAATVTRDIVPRPAAPAPPLRVGDAIHLRCESTAPAEVALINLGTTGKTTVVLPNGWSPRADIRPGVGRTFPSPADGFDFELGGPPGQERVVAVAVVGSSPVRLAPAAGDSFRVLEPADVDTLCDAVAALPGDRWGACLVEFTVLDRG